MLISRLLRRRSSDEATARRPGRGGSDMQLLPTPLDGGTVSCQVHDSEGRPLPEATVTVSDRLNQRLADGRTDSYGFFLTTLPPGLYRVSIAAGGYKRSGSKAEVRTNRHTSLGQIRLEQDEAMVLPEPGTWRFDPDHTEIRFTAQHIGMSKIHGRFNEFDGYIMASSPFENSRIKVAINAASIDTGVRMRDEHLRSADFFDVENYPQLYFTSNRLSFLRGDRWSVHGSLTLRGTTSPVTLHTTYLGQRSWNGKRAACTCTTELRREDYSVNWQQILNKGIAVVGPTIQIELDVQAVLKE